MASPQARLTHGSVGRHLVAMAVPMLLGIFTMMLQSFIDMWFIGQVGDRELAALSFAFPVLMVVTSVEKAFGIKIPNESIGRDAFQTVGTLAAFVRESMSQA